MLEKVVDILKEKTINVPKSLFLNYKLLKINELDLIILIYLINEDNTIFNPKKISENLNISLEEVLLSIDSLSSKDLIKIEIQKKDNIREEYFNLDNLYKKLSYLIVNDSKEETNDIYNIFAKEFGRSLSPIEIQIVRGWIDDQISEEIIIEALKEATYNGVSNLRYIDKILYEWRKKGINNPKDLEKNRTNHNIAKKDMIDYNWLDDNDE